MPWIQNIAKSDIKKGFHINPGENAMLIQICDPPGNFPEPKHNFKEVHQFQFLDVEENDEVLEEEMRCSQDQANELVRLLQHALDNRMNVIVHCHAGVCRSGAVCEVGVMMGFDDTEAFRSPNLLVKHRMMKSLGWYYSENEPHTINGVELDSGLIVPKNYHRRCMKRWQIVSNDSVWMFPPDVTVSTVELPVITFGDRALYEGQQYESCVFFANGDSDVVARYAAQEEAIAGHEELEKKYGLKRCSKLKI